MLKNYLNTFDGALSQSTNMFVLTIAFLVNPKMIKLRLSLRSAAESTTSRNYGNKGFGAHRPQFFCLKMVHSGSVAWRPFSETSLMTPLNMIVIGPYRYFNICNRK